MIVESPLTGNDNCQFIKSIQSEYIISKYRQNYEIDVSQYFENVDEVYIYECNVSKLRFYFPLQILGDSIFYKHFAKYEWYYRKNKWEFTKAKKHINKTQKVLEFGCGDGLFLDFLKEDGIQCAGLEINDSAIQNARQKGHLIFNDKLEDLSLSMENSYDIICSFQVFEHINNPYFVIKNLLKILKKNGQLLISVPNNDSFLKSDKDAILNMPPHHMLLWDTNSLKNLEKFFPLKVIDIYYEPLQKEHFGSYLKIITDPVVEKTGIFGKIIRRILLPVAIKLMPLFSKNITGQNIFVRFEKIS